DRGNPLGYLLVFLVVDLIGLVHQLGHLLQSVYQRDARGPSVRIRILARVLKATVRDPLVGPRRQTDQRALLPRWIGVTGSPPHFHARAASPAGDVETDHQISRPGFRPHL